MQKKIIALAIAAAFASAPAFADNAPTFFGQMNLSADMVSDGTPAPGASTTKWQLNSNTSRLGLKGSEDLGNGLSLVWFMEGTVFADKDTALRGFTFDRNTAIILKSDTMGGVLLGQNDGPYKSATRGLDLFGDGALDNRGSGTLGTSNRMMGGGNDGGAGNVVAYISPNMNGFSVAAATTFGAETASQPDATLPAPTKGTFISMAGMYSMDNIYATVAYQSTKFGSTGTGDLAGTVDDKNSALKAGVSYTMDQFTGNAVIEKLTNTVAAGASAGDTTNTNLYLAGKFKMSDTDAIKLAYAKIGTQTAPAAAGGDLKNDKTQITLGYDHSMSKTTSVYAAYAKVTQNATTGAASVQADPSILSFGVKHSF